LSRSTLGLLLILSRVRARLKALAEKSTPRKEIGEMRTFLPPKNPPVSTTR
jgi:hypothetical protein